MLVTKSTGVPANPVRAAFSGTRTIRLPLLSEKKYCPPNAPNPAGAKAPPVMARPIDVDPECGYVNTGATSPGLAHPAGLVPSHAGHE